MIRRLIEALLGRKVGEGNGKIDIRNLYAPSVIFYGHRREDVDPVLDLHKKDVVYLVTRQGEVHKRQGDTWIYLGEGAV
jgi:hypothetical protein